MGQLLQLIIRNGGFFTLLLVEAFCFYVTVQYNTKQNAIFTHTMGLASGNMLERRQKWVNYFSLEERADSLISANGALLAELAIAHVVQVPYRDTFLTVRLDTLHFGDSTAVRKIARPQYHFIAAKKFGIPPRKAQGWG